jgi:C4-dicarboxylate-specific signal transduction histidine kinase
MADQSNNPPPDDLAQAVAAVTSALIALAGGDLTARAERNYRGDSIDVLAFLVNSTAEEVADLIAQLEREREDLRRARDKLALAEKLAALGELAAGVAHELNQPLTVIRMVTDIVRDRPNATVAECARDLELISEAARRMGRIVDGVRAFARGTPLKRQVVGATKPLEDALLLVGETLRQSGIDLVRDYGEVLPGLVADADRLQQVFINLLVNARDAVDARELDAPRTIWVSAHRDGDTLRYAVEDTGTGVSDEHAPRIFDPFFTTKPVGRGTGLGLSVSHGIVSEHGGVLRHEARQGGGARFVVELPCTRPKTEPDRTETLDRDASSRDADLAD